MLEELIYALWKSIIDLEKSSGALEMSAAVVATALWAV